MFANKDNTNHVDERTWEEFRESGLFWFVNTTLHVFGWALVAEYVEGEFSRVYPARVKFRGFTEEINSNGYKKVARYMQDNADDLRDESEE